MSQPLSQTAANSMPSGIVDGHGGYYGDFLGSLGSKLGNWLSDKAQNFIGVGDYKDDVILHDADIGMNSLMNGTQAPKIANMGAAFIFRHREYVTDVVPNVNFTNTSYIIQPGNSKLFTWLAPLASAFEEYALIGMLAEYKPLISLTSTNANGAIVFATEYNVNKPNFTSKVAMENYEYATSCAPYQSMFHAIECDPQQSNFGSTHKNVLIGSVPAGQDARLYNTGNLQLAVQGQANNTGVIGEFWITYEIAFFKPLFSVGQGLNLLTDKYAGLSTLVAGTNPFFSTNFTPTLRSGSLLGTTYSSAVPGTTITFPSNISIGEYMITVVMNPTAAWSASWDFSNPATVTNATLLQLFSSDSLSAAFAGGKTGVIGAVSNSWIILINAPGSVQATFSFPQISAALTNNVNIDIIITQINGSIVT
jgi:hypothetical protein